MPLGAHRDVGIADHPAAAARSQIVGRGAQAAVGFQPQFPVVAHAVAQQQRRGVFPVAHAISLVALGGDAGFDLKAVFSYHRAGIDKIGPVAGDCIVVRRGARAQRQQT